MTLEELDNWYKSQLQATEKLPGSAKEQTRLMLQQKYLQMKNELGLNNEYEKYSDPDSEYYQTFRKDLTRDLTEAVSPDSLLGALMAAGGGYQGSQAIANQQYKAAQGRIKDYAGRATKDFYRQNQGIVTGIIGMKNDNNKWKQDFLERRRQYNEQNNNLIPQVLNIGAGILGGWAGGGLSKPKSGFNYSNTIDPVYNSQPNYNNSYYG